MVDIKRYDFYLLRIENEYGEVVYYGSKNCFTAILDKANHYSSFEEAYAIQLQIQSMSYCHSIAICHYKEL